MTYRNESPNGATDTRHLQSIGAPRTCTPTTQIRSAIGATFAMLALVATTMAAELPEAPSSVMRTNAAIIEAATPVRASGIVVAPSPEVKLLDKSFVSMAVISTGSAFADSYTTLFARQNWLAQKKGVCNEEVESAYLYGTHPTVGRAYAVASLKSAGSVFAAYYFRKHHSKFWSLPLVANTIMSLQGVGQNMATCN